MNFDRASKYLLIISVSSFLWWLGIVDETALGLNPSDLNRFAAPLCVFYFLFGATFFILGQYLPYLIVAGAAAVVVAWWKVGLKWTWTTELGSLVLAGAAAAVSVCTGSGKPRQLACAAVLVGWV